MIEPFAERRKKWKEDGAEQWRELVLWKEQVRELGWKKAGTESAKEQAKNIQLRWSWFYYIVHRVMNNEQW